MWTLCTTAIESEIRTTKPTDAAIKSIGYKRVECLFSKFINSLLTVSVYVVLMIVGCDLWLLLLLASHRTVSLNTYFS